MPDTDFTPALEASLADRMRATGLRKESQRAWAEVDRLKAALAPAREKLAIYRKLHPEYVGGMEYSQLMKMIDAALGIRQS
jgi:hypothetical protein